jgi:hypothetical protein
MGVNCAPLPFTLGLVDGSRMQDGIQNARR